MKAEVHIIPEGCSGTEHEWPGGGSTNNVLFVARENLISGGDRRSAPMESVFVEGYFLETLELERQPSVGWGTWAQGGRGKPRGGLNYLHSNAMTGQIRRKKRRRREKCGVLTGGAGKMGMIFALRSEGKKEGCRGRKFASVYHNAGIVKG